MSARELLRSLGYDFNNIGQLKKLGPDHDLTDEPYLYKINEDQDVCQDYYEKVGDAVTEYLYQLMETRERLIRLPVPKDSTSETGTFIFASRDYEQQDTLMILIQGSGPVRAGMWARSIVINQDIERGSQIPYIKLGLKKGFAILVLNPNANTLPNGEKIPGNRTPEEHALYVWETYVARSLASSIVIVGHSYGGVITIMLSLADQVKKDFEQRVKAVALADSVHPIFRPKIKEHLKWVGRNWVVSEDPLDTPVPCYLDKEIDMVAAGHTAHELTPHTAIESIFKYIDKRLAAKDELMPKHSLFEKVLKKLEFWKKK